jgi:hypothetical protein
MTEHSASIFVFFFLGEYSSLILMSAFMALFFLGGYHCPNLYNIILDPILYGYYYFSQINISYTDYLNYDTHIMEPCYKEYTFYQFIGILIDNVYGSYIFGLKIITVVFFFI